MKEKDMPPWFDKPSSTQREPEQSADAALPKGAAGMDNSSDDANRQEESAGSQARKDAEPAQPEEEGHGPKIVAMIRDAEPRLLRKLIELALQGKGNLQAIVYLLDRVQRIDQLNLGDV